MIAKKTPWRIFASQIKSVVGGDYRMIFLGYKLCKKNGFSMFWNFGLFLSDQNEMRINGWETHLKPEKQQIFEGDRPYQETGYNSRGCPFLKSFVRTSTGFEPVTLRYWCDVLTNWSWSIVCSRDECDRCIWNKSYKNCGNEIKWRVILAVMNAIYAIG